MVAQAELSSYLCRLCTMCVSLPILGVVSTLPEQITFLDETGRVRSVSSSRGEGERQRPGGPIRLIPMHIDHTMNIVGPILMERGASWEADTVDKS